jgi:hypothetical protein
MAFSAIWIAVASLLAAFDIEKAIDENGKVIEPTYEYISALVMCVFPSLRVSFYLLTFSHKPAFRNPINALSNLAQRKQKPSYAPSRIKSSSSYIIPFYAIPSITIRNIIASDTFI